MVLTEKIKPLAGLVICEFYWFSYISQHDPPGRIKSMSIARDDSNGSQFLELCSPLACDSCNMTWVEVSTFSFGNIELFFINLVLGW